ncbi:MAG: F0F1 ATP synthase subunit B [Eubacteriales bacterium]
MERIFGLDLQTLFDAFFSILSVGILFGFMSYYLFEPVTAYMKKRSDRIKNDLDIASQEKEDALELKQEYEEKIKDIKKEADVLLSKARRKALVREEEIIQEAKEEANKIIERARLEISREKDKVKDEVKQEIVSIATILAERFIATTIDEKEQNRLLEATLNEMGETTWLN